MKGRFSFDFLGFGSGPKTQRTRVQGSITKGSPNIPHVNAWVAFPCRSANQLSANKLKQKRFGQMFHKGLRELWRKKGKLGGGEGKKYSILTSQPCLPTSGSAQWPQQLCPCYRARYNARSGIWEKTVYKHSWIKPLFLLKLHFNALAALEISGGCAGAEQVWGECPQGILSTLSRVARVTLGHLCPPQPTRPHPPVISKPLLAAPSYL